jgi:hypothetical protein
MVGVFFMLFGERGREKLVKKSHSSPASHVQRKKKTYSAVQNDTIWVFFLRDQCMKRRCFGQNAPFHLKKRAAKTCQSPNQSSICDLFNQVLSCNFDFKYQFNCIPTKFNPQP